MKIFSLVLFVVLQANCFAQNLRIDSLPDSQIDIPIQINLKAIYALAERNVDTVFTSPNYPNDWVQADCATRYKYHFRRSPLRMAMTGTNLSLAFTGYYQIIGATRGCLNGTVLTPWSPSCRCGFEEKERRVNIGFNAAFKLQPNLLLLSTFTRTEPQALDKCEVCFWGQDVTKSVLDGLKAKLDASKKTMQDSFGVYQLRPQLQRVWTLLNDVFTVPNIGYFSLHPKKLRMEGINAKNDLLNITIGISATPVISLERPAIAPSVVPDLSAAANAGGFNIHLEAALQYDSLSKVLNNLMGGKSFDVGDGIFKKTVTVKQATVTGGTDGNLLFKLDFEGSFHGTVFFFGKPTYDATKKSIEVKDLDYELQTKNLLLKTAKWLFSNKITAALKKYSSVDLSSYYANATTSLNAWLNKEWTKGIKGNGTVTDLKLTAVHALPQHLLIRSNCIGNLGVIVSEIDLTKR